MFSIIIYETLMCITGGKLQIHLTPVSISISVVPVGVPVIPVSATIVSMTVVSVTISVSMVPIPSVVPGSGIGFCGGFGFCCGFWFCGSLAYDVNGTARVSDVSDSMAKTVTSVSSKTVAGVPKTVAEIRSVICGAPGLRLGGREGEDGQEYKNCVHAACFSSC